MTQQPAQGEGLSPEEAERVVVETTAGAAGLLPDALAALPSIHATGPVLDLVELSVAGVVDHGFVLPGTPAAVPVPLPLQGSGLPTGAQVVLEDDEGVPVALVEIGARGEDADGRQLAAGTLTPLRPLSRGPFRLLRRSPVEVAADAPSARLVVTTTRPMTSDEVALSTTQSLGGPVLVLALVGAGRRPYPSAVALVRALVATLDELPAGSLVVPVAVPATGSAVTATTATTATTAALLDAGVRAAVATAYAPDADQAHLPDAAASELDWLVEEGTGLPAASLAVLRTQRRPLPERGLVLLFTGLSGSGKSTLAHGVAEWLQESTDRTVTLLDGDVVRRHLSKGLGFSREDRDTNVRRIGFVAAEVARHGGVAICAPIAPYAATRDAVREMVEEAGGLLVVVHVSTPLEVCEARDRKGLYARARVGLIPEFTGVSDPYENPVDPDLRLDTSAIEVDDAVDAVLGMLRGRTLVRVDVPEV